MPARFSGAALFFPTAVKVLFIVPYIGYHKAMEKKARRAAEREEKNMNVEIRYVAGHVEVYRGGEFWFSADNTREAMEELAG